MELTARIKDTLASQVPDTAAPRKDNRFVKYVEELLRRVEALEEELDAGPSLT